MTRAMQHDTKSQGEGLVVIVMVILFVVVVLVGTTVDDVVSDGVTLRFADGLVGEDMQETFWDWAMGLSTSPRRKAMSVDESDSALELAGCCWSTGAVDVVDADAVSARVTKKIQDWHILKGQGATRNSKESSDNI